MTSWYDMTTRSDQNCGSNFPARLSLSPTLLSCELRYRQSLLIMPCCSGWTLLAMVFIWRCTAELNQNVRFSIQCIVMSRRELSLVFLLQMVFSIQEDCYTTQQPPQKCVFPFIYQVRAREGLSSFSSKNMHLESLKRRHHHLGWKLFWTSKIKFPSQLWPDLVLNQYLLEC